MLRFEVLAIWLQSWMKEWIDEWIMNVRIPNLEHILNSREDSNSRPHEFVCSILGAYDTHSYFNVCKIWLEFQRALIQKWWPPTPSPLQVLREVPIVLSMVPPCACNFTRIGKRHNLTLCVMWITIWARFSKNPLGPGWVAQWIECRPVNQQVASLIPGHGTCLGCGPGLQ